MALPTRDEILTGEYSFDGSPWASTASKSTMDLDTIEYSFDGSPWTGTNLTATSTLTLNKILFNSISTIDKILNVTKSIIKSVLGAEIVFAGVLDTFTGSTHSYSLRRLSSAYTGPAINITRASDSSTTDIGFVGEDLDTSAINTFCTGTTCYVNKIYDQVGSTDLPASIGTTAVIYESGAVTTQNGKPAIKMYGDYFTTGSVEHSDLVTSSHCYNISVSSFDGSNDNFTIQFGDAFSNSSFLGFGSSAAFSLNETNIYTFDFTYGASAGTHIAEGVYASSSSISMYMDGTAITPSSSQNGSFSPSGTTNLIIGQICDYFQEALIWNSDQSSNRSGIYSNVSTYW